MQLFESQYTPHLPRPLALGRRIAIVGCPGAGKSYLSRRLHECTGLPLIHLDKEHWLPGWQEPDPGAWENRVRELAAREAWIMDGNYGGTQRLRLHRAETVIFLDRSRWTCLRRVVWRVIRDYGRVRPDMGEGCPEQFDWAFLKYVYHFKEKHRPRLVAKLANLNPDHTQVLVLRTQREVERLLRQL